MLTLFVILGVYFFKKRAEKRVSAQFEASLGRTNFANEKGSIRSEKSGRSGRSNFGSVLTKDPSIGKGSNISPPYADTSVTPGGRTIPVRPERKTMVPEKGVQWRLTGDGGARKSVMMGTGSPNGVIPLPGLEKRVSGGSLEAASGAAEAVRRPGMPAAGTGLTFRSETFDRLLYDVQSEPF